MNTGSFKRGYDARRNEGAILRPGHEHRWPRGVSGNPLGKSRGLIRFERAFAKALIGEGTPEELAKMIWDAARKHESWAILKLSERFEWQRAETTEQDRDIKVVFVDKAVVMPRPLGLPDPEQSNGEALDANTGVSNANA